jgi:hypothetical protein
MIRNAFPNLLVLSTVCLDMIRIEVESEALVFQTGAYKP